MATVKYSDLLEAFDFVSANAEGEHRAYLSMDTGAIYWLSEYDELGDALPDDLETSDRYLAVPHKNELDLGNRLAITFAEGHLPDYYERVVDMFRRRGAYGRFKELLASMNLENSWYAFEGETTRRALAEWCTDNDVTLVNEIAAP